MSVRTELSRLVSGLAAGATVAAAVIALRAAGALQPLELQTYDLRMQWSLPHPPAPGEPPVRAHPDIIILDISEESIQWMAARGTGWPWRRSELAKLLRACSQEEFEANAVLFDLFTLVDLDPYREEPAVIDALRGTAPVYVSVPFRQNAVPTADARPDLERLLVRHAIEVENDGSVQPMEGFRKSVILPVTGIAEAIAGICDVETPEDRDGITRQYRLLSLFHGRYYPSFALAALMAREKTRKVVIREGTLHVGRMAVPVDRQGTITLKYYPPGRSFQLQWAHRVVEGLESYEKEGAVTTFDPSLLKDKTVFVGTDAASLFDLKVTPVADAMPGVEIHAIALANILNGETMRSVAWPVPILAILLAALATALATRFTGPMAGGAAAVVLFLGYVAFNASLFSARQVLDLTGPLAAITLSFAVTSAVNYLYEGRQRQRVKRDFQRYLSPKVVDKILRNADALELKGERKPLSLFFMDFAGFTTMSETLDPAQLVKLISEYHHEAAEEIFKTEGTIDKYIGDAIMAFWNDPMDQPDHALRACLAAVGAQSRLRDLARRMRERGLPEMHARIGLNTGIATVGNMGARGQVNYTAIGDEVNLASRLEGANKEFGTEILASEATARPALEFLEARELALIKVKGKNHPVRVFELLGRKGEVPAARLTEIRRFEQALADFRARRFAEARSAFRALMEAHDRPSRTYVDLCEEYLRTPPPPDWDTSYRMESK